MFESIAVVLAILAACGITVRAAKNWPGDRYLCDTCKYNAPEKCKKKERPKALVCYAFSKVE